MDINLPLILFLLVAFTGVVWALDIFFMRKKRLAAIAELDKQFANLPEEKKNSDRGYQKALAEVSREPAVVEYSKSFFPVLLLVFVLRSFIVEPFQIPSESMVPTLEVGDFIAVNKFTYGIRLPIVRTKVIDVSEPERGDVMVFFPPNETRYFIKRVIGLPGDKVSYIDNVLYINGEEIPQEFVRAEPALRRGEQCYGSSYVVVEEKLGDESHLMRKCVEAGRYGVNASWTVPEGHYFMMGDNRDNSLDSRDWGVVPEDRIVGKAFAIWMHWDDFFSLPSFSRVGTI